MIQDLPVSAKHAYRKATRAPEEHTARFTLNLPAGDGFFILTRDPRTFTVHGHKSQDQLAFITVEMTCGIPGQGRLTIRLNYRRSP